MSRRNSYVTIRRRRKAKRSLRIRRLGLILLGVAVAIAVLAYLYRSDLFAWAGAAQEEPAGEEPSSKEPDPEEPPPEQPSQDEDPQLDAPEPDEPPADPQPEPPALKVVADGDYLLALVTKETTLKKDYEPRDLVKIPAYMNPPRDLYLRAEAFAQLEKLWQAAKEDGVTLAVLSAYRSYSYQVGLFNSYAKKHGEAAANRFSARAGQSEHQLGTAIDFGGTKYDFTDAFGETPQGKWLAENAHLFGFAMSYPKRMEHITGYIYEPWHFRYIGVEMAEKWKESGLTLCEFLELQTQYWE
ncbi:MAG: M15 family metallopeptidase [Firmicutes bacterium]|nr:M15 family metallopeptidase [Bacillota bacterium]HPU01697.1 M15 family metallopeptidase [Bacillota bacterium]